MVAARILVDVNTATRIWTRPRGLFDSLERLLLFFRPARYNGLVLFASLSFVEGNLAVKAVACLTHPAVENVAIISGEEGSCWSVSQLAALIDERVICDRYVTPGILGVWTRMVLFVLLHAVFGGFVDVSDE